MTRQQLMHFFVTPTARLAGIHLAIIMLLSISFSIVFYHTSDRQFARPLPPFSQSLSETSEGFSSRFNDQLRSAIDDRFDQTRQALLLRLIWLNIGTLLLGAGVSYLLARWSLRPIEEAMELQTQFVSDASHELRTPLTVLQTSNEVALRKTKLSAAEVRTLVGHNIEEVKRLKDLSDTLLDLLKGSNDEVYLQKVNLQDVVGDALPPIVSIAQEKNINLEDTVPDVSVQTNRALLARIVAILLDNAVKYSHHNSQVSITAEHTGKKILLHVSDTGIGIRSSDIPLIFNRFYRADKSRSSIAHTQGYGLGLSIAEKIAQRIDANISVKSIIGKGSTFTVELPIY